MENSSRPWTDKIGKKRDKGAWDFHRLIMSKLTMAALAKAQQNVEDSFFESSSTWEKLAEAAHEAQPVLFAAIPEILPDDEDDYWQTELATSLIVILEAGKLSGVKFKVISEQQFHSHWEKAIELIGSDTDEAKLDSLAPYSWQPDLKEYLFDQLAELGVNECGDNEATRLSCLALALLGCLADAAR